MDKVDVRATKRRIKELEKEADVLGDKLNEVWDAQEELEKLLQHWAEYKVLVKEWGKRRPLPETQFCIICGRPMLSNRKRSTCEAPCRQEAYRRRKAGDDNEHGRDKNEVLATH